jgi:hypothetical protein
LEKVRWVGKIGMATGKRSLIYNALSDFDIAALSSLLKAKKKCQNDHAS